MYQAFDEAATEDLFYESAEGPAATSYDELDSLSEFDEWNDDGFDGFDEFDTFDEEAADALEAIVVDALDAADGDEFLGGLFRGIAGLAAGPVGQTVGRAAQAISDSLSADEADEFEMLDALSEWLEDEGEEAIDAVAPVLAGLALRTALPAVTRLTRPLQRQLVRSVGQSARTLASQRGPQAVRALVPIVRSVQRSVQGQRLPVRAVSSAIRQRTSQVARNPRTLQRLVQPIRRTTSRAYPRPGMARSGRVPLRPGATTSVRPAIGRSRRLTPDRGRVATGGGIHRPGARRPIRGYGSGVVSRPGGGRYYPGRRRPYGGRRPGRVGMPYAERPMGGTATGPRRYPARPIRRPVIASDGRILSDRLPLRGGYSQALRPRAAVCARCGGVHRHRRCGPVYISVRGC